MGIKSGMSYVGAKNLKELVEKSKFTLISSNSLLESYSHSVQKIWYINFNLFYFI